VSSGVLGHRWSTPISWDRVEEEEEEEEIRELQYS